MNLIQSQDRVLLGGLAVAMIVVFARPIQYLLDLAADAQRASGLALVPALVILTAVFIFHEQSKRQEVKARALAAEAEAREAQARTAEMERLVTFGRALARSLDFDALRDAVQQHLPTLAGTTDASVMYRAEGRWQMLAGSPHDMPADVARTCDRVASTPQATPSRTAAVVSVEGRLWLPITAGGETIAVLMLPERDAPADAGRRTFAAAATLLGVSLRNAQLFHDVKEHSVRDGLTGCYNRTHAMEVIDIELRRARRSLAPLSLIMFDLDHFKDINDRHGHLGGDAVLAAVGARMRDVLRGSDLKCRYGGEEFLVLLPETPLDGAHRVAESLRRELAVLPIHWSTGTIPITASFGVTAALPSEISPEAFIARADAALYRAKDQGRNCVRLSLESAVA